MKRLTTAERLVYACAFTKEMTRHDPYDCDMAITEAAWSAHCAVAAFRHALDQLAPKADPSYETLHAFARKR